MPDPQTTQALICSPELDKIAPALLAAQKALKNPSKNCKNPFIGNRYADLGACMESAISCLNKNDIAISQVFAPAPAGYVGLTTLAVHKTGQYIGGTIFLPSTVKEKDKDGGGSAIRETAQGAGSAATYARRYGVAAICGMVADDDDDASEASGAGSKLPSSKPKSIFGKR